MIQFRYLEDDAFFSYGGKVWKKEENTAIDEDGKRVVIPPTTNVDPIDAEDAELIAED